jgi:hypothetical protein
MSELLHCGATRARQRLFETKIMGPSIIIIALEHNNAAANCTPHTVLLYSRVVDPTVHLFRVWLIWWSESIGRRYRQWPFAETARCMQRQCCSLLVRDSDSICPCIARPSLEWLAYSDAMLPFAACQAWLFPSLSSTHWHCFRPALLHQVLNDFFGVVVHSDCMHTTLKGSLPSLFAT